MKPMNRRICVFTGSSSGSRPIYIEAARAFGSELVNRGYGLVFGGGAVGLMGVIADTVLAAGGHVVGVIPQALVNREVAHKGLSALHVVDSMHERKALMTELADGFVALPGGFGTADELFEVLTWAQLGIHRKPCGLLDVAGYFEPLLRYMDRCVAEGFVKPAHRRMVLTADDPSRLLSLFEDYQAPRVDKLVDLDHS